MSCIWSFVSFKGTIYLDNILQVKFITFPEDGGDSVFFVNVAMYLYILLLSLNVSSTDEFMIIEPYIYTIALLTG